MQIKIDGLTDQTRPVRFETFREARNHHITGFVKSLGQSSLLIDIEGETEAMSHFTAWCEEFFSWKQVSQSEIVPRKLPRYADFLIMDLC